jgi:hypothetical protein
VTPLPFSAPTERRLLDLYAWDDDDNPILTGITPEAWQSIVRLARSHQLRPAALNVDNGIAPRDCAHPRSGRPAPRRLPVQGQCR